MSGGTTATTTMTTAIAEAANTMPPRSSTINKKRRIKEGPSNSTLSSLPQRRSSSSSRNNNMLRSKSSSEVSKMVRVINVWRDTTLEAKNSRRRVRRSASLKVSSQPRVGFHPPLLTATTTTATIGRDGTSDDDDDDDDDAVVHQVLVETMEFDPDEAVLSMHDPSFLSQDHDEVPWYELPYEDLPWWEYPDLEEDDEVTALCKDALRSSMHNSSSGRLSYHHSSHGHNLKAEADQDHHLEQQQADRVEAILLSFCLKLKNRATFTQLQQAQLQAAVDAELMVDAGVGTSNGETIDQMLEDDTHDQPEQSCSGQTTAEHTLQKSKQQQQQQIQEEDATMEQEEQFQHLKQQQILNLQQDQQDAMQKLLHPSSPTMPKQQQQQQQHASSSIQTKIITKEDVANMATLPTKKQQPTRRYQNSSGGSKAAAAAASMSRSSSVLDDDNVSLHSAVLSTGWNRLNIHNSEMRRYQKNHRTPKKGGRRGGGVASRGLWADDHTVMVGASPSGRGSGSVGNDHDDGKSVSSFQSSPAMMEYSKTKQSWCNKKKKEPKVIHRLSTSATFVADEQPGVTPPVPALKGKKKKKKKKKKVGHLGLFMAKEELRPDKESSNIFDIMEEIPETSNHANNHSNHSRSIGNNNNQSNRSNLSAGLFSQDDQPEKDPYDSADNVLQDSFHMDSDSNLQAEGDDSSSSNNNILQGSEGSVDMVGSDTHFQPEDGSSSSNVLLDSQGSLNVASGSNLRSEGGSSSNVLFGCHGSLNAASDGGDSSQGSLNAASDDSRSSLIVTETEVKSIQNTSQHEQKIPVQANGSGSTASTTDLWNGGLQSTEPRLCPETKASGRAKSKSPVPETTTGSLSSLRGEMKPKKGKTKVSIMPVGVQAKCNNSAPVMNLGDSISSLSSRKRGSKQENAPVTSALLQQGVQRRDIFGRGSFQKVFESKPEAKKGKPSPSMSVPLGASMSSLGSKQKPSNGENVAAKSREKPEAKKGKPSPNMSVPRSRISNNSAPEMSLGASIASLGRRKMPCAAAKSGGKPENKQGKTKSPMSMTQSQISNNSSPQLTAGESSSSFGSSTKQGKAAAKSGTGASQEKNGRALSTHPTSTPPKKEPMRQQAARCASGSGLGLGFGSMHLPNSTPRFSSNSTKAEDESTTREAKTKKRQPFMTRRASFSEIQISQPLESVGAAGEQESGNGDRPTTEDAKFRLVMLRHAATCSLSQKGGVCPSDPKCSQMKELLRHMTLCKHHSTTVQCSFPGCHESKTFLMVLHKTNQILARQQEFEKSLPPVVMISKPTRKINSEFDSSDSDTKEFDDDDDISDIGSFGSAGDLNDDSSHDNQKRSVHPSQLDGSTRSENHGEGQVLQEGARERMQGKPTWNGSVELKAQRTLSDRALVEKMNKEEEERQKAQDNLRKKHAEVKARMRAKVQKAKGEKGELDAKLKVAEQQKREDISDQTRGREEKIEAEQQKLRQIRFTQERQAADAEARQERLKQELDESKARAAASSAALLRDEAKIKAEAEIRRQRAELKDLQEEPQSLFKTKAVRRRKSLSANNGSATPRRDEEKIKTEAETRRKNAELKAKQDTSKLETLESEAAKPVSSFKTKAVRRKSLPLNTVRSAPLNPVRRPTVASTEFERATNVTRNICQTFEDKTKVKTEKQAGAVRKHRVAIYKAREEKSDKKRQEEAAHDAAEEAALKKKGAQIKRPLKESICGKVDPKSQKVYDNNLEAQTAVERIKAAKLAKKLKKEKKRASMVAAK